MNQIVLCALVTIAWSSAAVVFARSNLRRLFAFSLFGVSLALLFFAYRAPDVALSEIAIGTVLLPFLFLVALVKIAEQKRAGKA